ncbi:helix-turn-helix domain-containing protein [Psychrobacter sp. 1U1]|uniref:helix-turn-helix domain-containing protein n=1 Tax=Psychrobacter sp. 1U1 TaxID=3453576 RepID=UPI003F44D511
MTRRKNWSLYTHEEIESMKKSVTEAHPNTPFSPEYAAAYLGKSISTLQYMRCHKSDGIIYSKVGGHIVYRKKHLEEYLNKFEKLFCTAHY